MASSSREAWAVRRDESLALVGSARRAAAALGVVSAQSAGGAVSVSIDAQGTIHEVAVGPGWRQETEPEGLTGLVFATLTEAQTKLLGEFTQTFGEELEQPRRLQPVEEIEQRALALRGRAGDRSVTEAIREVGGLHDALDELIDAMREIADARHTGRSSSGHVTAVATGRQEVVELSIDQRWLARAHHFNIGREITGAMVEALSRAARVSMQDAVARTRLGRLQALLTESTPTTLTTPEDD